MTSIPLSATNVRRRSISGTTIGRIVTALPVLFLAFDTAIKFSNVPAVAETMNQLGYAPSAAPIIGILELVCLAIYLVPRTAVLGAVLFTGYLGGAIASYVRMREPYPVLVPLTTCLLLWLGLYLREERLRALLPFRR